MVPATPICTDEESTGGQNNVAYTVFSKQQKRWIVFLIAFAGMFSPLSSFIYYPAINSLASSLHTSVEAINLTITSYMVVSGITPSILGGTADQIGRRPIYMFSFLVYFIANIGLSLQQSFPALLVLRVIQSIGSSGTIAIAYGVIADIAPPAERGSYVGAVLCGPNVAPSLGPVIGGALADQVGWRWIFWFLTIISGVCLATLVCALPETGRKVVGNGSIPASGIYRSLWSRLGSRAATTTIPGFERPKSKLSDLNFLRRLNILLYKDTAPILLTNAIFYMIYCCVQASLSNAFITIYHYNELTAGLVYIPFGVGCALASFGSGKIMNRDYRITARKHDFAINYTRGDDLSNFPIEQARLRSIWYMLALATGSVAGYGWALYAKTHVAVILVLQFFIGTATTVIFNICGTLLVDLHPDCPSAVSALLNLIRCSLSAVGLAILQIIIDGIGIGWCFTIFTFIAAMTVPLLLAESKWGMQWRLARMEKQRSANGGLSPPGAGSRGQDPGHNHRKDDRDDTSSSKRER